MDVEAFTKVTFVAQGTEMVNLQNLLETNDPWLHFWLWFSSYTEDLSNAEETEMGDILRISGE